MKLKIASHPLFPAGIAALATAGAGVAAWMATSGLDGSFWMGMPLGKAGLSAEYCELNRMEAFVRQPMNTWSNFCYLFLGVWAWVWAWQDSRRAHPENPQQRFPWMSALVGLMLAGLCFGSWFFHASLTRAGQHWDMGFAYGLGVALGFAAGHRVATGAGMVENARWRWVFLMMATAGILLMFWFKWALDGRVALPVVMLSGVVQTIWLYFREKGRFSGRILVMGLVMMVLAGVTRSLDLAKVGCDPLGWAQWHAAWHLFTGLAGFSFLAFLRGEKP